MLNQSAVNVFFQITTVHVHGTFACTTIAQRRFHIFMPSPAVINIIRITFISLFDRHTCAPKECATGSSAPTTGTAFCYWVKYKSNCPPLWAAPQPAESTIPPFFFLPNSGDRHIPKACNNSRRHCFSELKAIQNITICSETFPNLTPLELTIPCPCTICMVKGRSTLI